MKAIDKQGRIHEIGDNAHGQDASSGYYVVSPDGPEQRLVLQANSMPMKDGWRVATEADIEHFDELERARKQPPSSSSQPFQHEPAKVDSH